MDEGLTRRLAKAGAGLGVGGVLLLITAIFTGLQGPYWRPVMAFGIVLTVASFGFMAALLIRLHMFLKSQDDIVEYTDLFGRVKTSPRASQPDPGAVGSDKPTASQEAPPPGITEPKRLRGRLMRRR